MNFGIRYDDRIKVWIEDSEVFYGPIFANYNLSTFNYTFEADKLYYAVINLSNPGGNVIGQQFNWDASGSLGLIPDSYKYYPSRVINTPFLLESLVYDTYCDDVAGFRCIVCDIPLCLECYKITSSKKCITCKDHSYVDGTICRCELGYYLHNSDKTNCLECVGLCNECYEDIGGML